MCGIAGIVNLNGKPVSGRILKKMTKALIHRGPDGEGHWIEENIGIGHRRLAILDLSKSGDQPMVSNNKRYIISYNGEIYNYLDLKKKLVKKGFTFKSRTDTEVILNSFIEFGPSCVNTFNGMFAYVIWDRQKKELHLARDRYGIKPLYYGFFGNNFIFASEQKALAQHPDFKKEINKKSLLEYFTFQNILTDNMLLSNVKIIEPGKIGKIEYRNNKKLVLTQYWDFNFKEPQNIKDHKSYEIELNRLIKKAVKNQLVSDVELGAFLSGGIDSSIITSIASKKIPNLKTFTCGFDLSSASGIELNFDERQKAEALSNIYKTVHNEMVLKSGDMEKCLDKLSYHLEEPRVGQSYPNYYISKLASDFVKVTLSGIGGDELFGGYPWRYYKTASSNSFEDFIDKYYLYWQRLLDNSEIKKVFSPIWNDVKDVWTRDIFRDVFKNYEKDINRPEDYINYSLYFEAKTFLHGLFIVEDKLSMANSLEVRVPFMDNDLVEFAMQCPVSLKLNKISENIRINENIHLNKQQLYFLKTNDGKQILRKIAKKHIPNGTAEYQKQGFSSPDSSWFKGESLNFVKNTILQKNSKIYDFFDFKSIHKLVNSHLDGKKNRRLLIWSLLNFESILNQE